MPVPDVMGLAEIAKRLGVSKSYARRLAEGRTFPAGAKLAMGQVWDRLDVEAWIAHYRPHPAEPPAR